MPRNAQALVHGPTTADGYHTGGRGDPVTAAARPHSLSTCLDASREGGGIGRRAGLRMPFRRWECVVASRRESALVRPPPGAERIREVV